MKRNALLATALLCVQLLAPALAEAQYIANGTPDGIALLPPPPAPDSEEQAGDLLAARATFKGRTPEQEARALQDASLSFKLFAPVIGPVFDLDKLPKTQALLLKVRTNISETINVPKNFYKRLRPYQIDPALNLAKPEASYSYPSGHSTRGYVYAALLAELFPEKREPILEFGRTIGWDRVLIGKHFPTDVHAGRILGRAIMRELMASPAFQHDLAEAKAEIHAARQSASAK